MDYGGLGSEGMKAVTNVGPLWLGISVFVWDWKVWQCRDRVR